MSLPRATFRKLIDDFVVDEIPAYSAGGEGEHLFVTLRKRDVTTLDAVSRICRALKVDERGAGFAGMKDRRAVATQTISVPFALDRDVERVRHLNLTGIEILGAARHRNKLKPGHLDGNRFAIVLRNIEPQSVEGVERALETAAREGVPNAFGPQRFGRDGDNPERALSWLSGRSRGPRDRREQRLLFSALQSHFFNEVLAQREKDGTWATPLLGDLVKKRDTGGIFSCEDPAVDGQRALAGEVSPTGPIFGAKMRWPVGQPGEIEREVLRRAAGAADAFERHARLGEGSRRPLRLMFEGLAIDRLGEEAGALRVHFVLPKGCYATTVLARAVTLTTDPSQSEESPTIEAGGHLATRIEEQSG